jgi:purine nucleoside permease
VAPFPLVTASPSNKSVVVRTQDLFYKRFIRDYIRYKDELTCAAAHIAKAVRERAKSNRNDNAAPNNGECDAFHIRRGDFQYKKTRVSADMIYDIGHNDLMTEGATVYITTDERDKSFFKALASYYDVVYLDDYLHPIPNLYTHYYSMIDQLVASK